MDKKLFNSQKNMIFSFLLWCISYKSNCIEKIASIEHFIWNHVHANQTHFLLDLTCIMMLWYCIRYRWVTILVAAFVFKNITGQQQQTLYVYWLQDI